MREIIFIFVFLILNTGVYSDVTVDSSVDLAIEYIVRQEYSQAEKYLDSILNIEPENIDAIFLHLNLEQVKIVDYESYAIYGHDFLKSADSALSMIERKIREKSGNSIGKCLFYKGTIFGLKSLVFAKMEEWFNAYKFAHASVKELKKALKTDPSLYEASYGIGLYNYYIGEALKWIPFMGIRSKKGLSNIIEVAKSESPISYMAKNSLSWIYIERKEYEKANRTVLPILEKYPENTLFLRIKARIALLTSDYNSAVSLGKKLADLSEKRTPVNWSDMLCGYQTTVAALDALGRKEECLKVLNKVLGLKVPLISKKIIYVRKHWTYLENKEKKLKSNMELE